MKLVSLSQKDHAPWLWTLYPSATDLPQIRLPDSPGVKHYALQSTLPHEFVDDTIKKLHVVGTPAELHPFEFSVPLEAFSSAKALHEYQYAHVTSAVFAPGKRWLFNDDTGLGKSAQALSALDICWGAQSGKVPRVLIVCPAMVREAWRNEVKHWLRLPDALVGVVDVGPKRKLSKKQEEKRQAAYNSKVIITSYNLMHHFVGCEFDAVIWDEIHKLKSPDTDYFMTAQKFAEVPLQYGLSATAMPDKPVDFWGTAEILWPGRFGTEFEFKQYYAEAFHNGHGWAYKGINAVHADDLKYRLSQCSSRTVRQEVAHLLPAIDISITKLTKGFDEGVLEWARDSAEHATHFAILTHLRKTAWYWQDKLQRAGVQNVLCLTGGVSTEQRAAALAALKNTPTGVLVATMHSVGIGIDLTFCQNVLLIELDYTPEAIIQALGRFSRLSGTTPSHVVICVRNGSEEVKARALSHKLEAINKAVKNSEMSTKLQAALAAGSAVDIKHFLTAIDAGEDDPYTENYREE